MILNVGHTDPFNTVSQYLSLEWFKTACSHEAYNADNILSLPPFSDEHTPDWLEGVGLWNFPEVGVCLGTILSYIEIKLDLRNDPQCNESKSNVLATHPFYSKNSKIQLPIRVKAGHVITHAPSPGSCPTFLVWSQMFSTEHIKIVILTLVSIYLGKSKSLI